MQAVTLVKWGNSIGIRLPTALLKQAHLAPGEELKIILNKKGELAVTPISDSQKSWTEAFNAIADKKEDKLLTDILSEFDKDEWAW